MKDGKKTLSPELKTLGAFVESAFRRQNATTLEAYFTVGDRIALAVASTGIRAMNICKMLKAAGVEACSVTTLRWTVTFAGTFTKTQRASLLKMGMPVMRAMALCHKSISSEARGKLIDQVKRGVTPWTHIESPGQAAQKERLRFIKQTDAAENVEMKMRTITFYWTKDGESPDWDAIENGLRALRARIGADHFAAITARLQALAS